jgi:hypothetical protein
MCEDKIDRAATGECSMTVYAIVQLKMTDRAAYDRYQARFFEVLKIRRTALVSG